MFFRRKNKAEKPKEVKPVAKGVMNIFRGQAMPGFSRSQIIEAALASTLREPQPFDVIRQQQQKPQNIMAMDSSYDNFHRAQLLQPNIPELQVQWYGTQGFIGFQFCAMISQHWLVNKACTMPARDAVRTGFQIKNSNGESLTPDEVAQLNSINIGYKLAWNLEQFARFNRIFGIRIAIFKVRGADAAFYEKPFNPDSIKEGDYEGISQVDPYWCTPGMSFQDGADPSAINFYDPTYWTINGIKYHRSHLCIIRGDELPDILKPTYIYAGMSLPQKIYERVYAAERTANEAPMLVQTKRLNVLKMDTSQGQLNEESLINTLQQMNAMRDNYGWRVCDTSEEVNQLDTALSDLDSVIMTQYQLVASIANVPVTKLLGTVPKGFNTTGEYDESNYHEELESIQTHELQPLLDRHLLMLSLSHKEFRGKKLIAVWNELDSPTSKEASEVEYLKAQTDSLLANAGAIDGRDIRNRLSTDPDSPYLGVDNGPENDLDDEEMPDGEIESEVEGQETGGTVQQISMNGAQIASLVQVLEGAAAKTLTPESAKEILAAAFPSLTQEQVAKMVDPMRKAEPPLEKETPTEKDI